MQLLGPASLFDPNDAQAWLHFLGDHEIAHGEIAAQAQAKYGVSLPNTPLDGAPDVDWLEAHNLIHQAISEASGIQSYDLSVVDLKNPEMAYSWLQYHAWLHDQAILPWLA